MSKKPYYITTPIYYPSGNPHIGHCYTTVACDSIARYRRMQGYDVIFLTGTDEHGLKIEQKAAAKGVTPKEYVDEIVKTFKALWAKMHISYDRYIRTTDDYHVETVQKIFKKLYDLGYIYKGEYKGKYCTPCESFWTESQLDENGCCPECHREVTEAKEEAYFMKMSPFADRIEKLLTETDYLQPKTRAVELVNNFIKPGLEDLCVSRTSFKWGIPVTFDPDHVVYVWVDALSNYISALGYGNEAYHDFDRYWPADVHMVAKDIMRFHAIIWPAMLMALDLPLPKHLAVHGWITFNGQKMSKSLGNFFTVREVAEQYGYEVIRYMMVQAHYRSPINYCKELLDACKASLERLYVCRDTLDRAIAAAKSGEISAEATETFAKRKEQFITAMDDDLNTADGMTAIFELVRDLNRMSADASTSKEQLEAGAKLFDELTGVMGLLYNRKQADTIPAEVTALVEQRQAARKAKDFAEADRLRDEIAALGYAVRETRQGTEITKIDA